MMASTSPLIPLKGVLRWTGTDIQTFSSPGDLLGNSVQSLCEDRTGRIWIGLQNGISRWLAGHFDHLTKKEGLPDVWINFIRCDREGNVWIGNQQSLTQLWGDTFRYYTTRSGLPSNMVWTVHTDPQGALWVGTDDGLCRFSNQGKTIFSTLDGLPSNRIQSITQTRDGALWACTGAGIARFNGQGFESILRGQLDIPTYTIEPETDGSLLIGTSDGLAIYDGHDLTMKHTSTEPGSNKTIMMQRDSLGRLWMAARNGLICRENGVYKTYTTRDGLSSNQIHSLHFDARGRLWIGTLDAGLDMWNGQRFVNLSVQDGLLDNVIVGVLGDDLGGLWIATNFGISRLDLKAYDTEKRVELRHFRKSEGFLGVECNGNALQKNNQGLIVVGTAGGVMIIDPQHLPSQLQPPKTILADLRIFQKTQPALTKLWQSGIELRLPWQQNHLTFDYLGIHLTRPDQIRYRYRLDGAEPDWSPITTERSATYASLPPGHFRFLVQAGLHGGTWDTPQEIFIWIMAPFWKTWWFVSCAALLLLVLIVGVIRWRIRLLLARKAELERLITERTGQLQAAYEEVSRLSITDALTGLYNRRYFQAKVEKDVSLTMRQNSRRSNQPVVNALGFLMIDIDHFKEINDTHGHAAGDIVLQAVPEALLSTIRTSDTLVRWGGEEFLVMAQENGPRHTAVLAERIRRAVANTEITLPTATLYKTVSVGFCNLPLLADNIQAFSWEDSIQLADSALYLAKKNGRNRSIGIEPKQSELPQEAIDLVKTDLEQAITQGSVVIMENLGQPG